MGIAKLSHEQAANIIATGIQHMLREEIKAKLKPFRDELVAEIDATFEDACRSAAEQTVCRVVEYHNLYDAEIQLHIHFGEKHAPEH